MAQATDPTSPGVVGRRDNPLRDGWRQALIAAALAVGAALLARFILQITTPAEIYAETLIRFVPLTAFSWLVGTLGPGAKHLFFGTVLIGAGIIAALVGLLYCALRAALLRRIKHVEHGTAESAALAIPTYVETPLVVLLLWLVTAGILAPILGGGFFGANFAEGVVGTLLTQLLPDTVFALAFIWLLRATLLAHPQAGIAADQTDAAMRVSRRRLLNRGLAAVMVAAGATLAWEFITSSLGLNITRRPPLKIGNSPQRIVPPPKPVYGPWTPLSAQTPEVTANEKFYYVSKNFVGDPQIDGKTWKLTITGSVTNPVTLTYDQLRALPAVERYHSLECISNEVGGNLMSNALFRGARLADLLDYAVIRPGANELIFRAADDYSDRLHLSQAMDPMSLIVYEINGAPLPQAHGYPARLLIPGLYGMKNGKWLTSLEVSSGDYLGYWETRGWTKEATVKMTSRIDLPTDGAVLTTKPTWIAGVAYAADRGIGRVEVSTDAGATWHTATLRRPLGALTWVLWQYQWQPTSGSHVLAVRAIDLDGNVQTATEAPPLPDGASGFHAVQVLIG
ncbi:MAG TPA: molybdopterin-dependent oxidoreductase [Ktedonobacterales bacterium]|nr:molybdopterin-dependent oxidoreductase [Ktedonobacterales bacterium]